MAGAFLLPEVEHALVVGALDGIGGRMEVAVVALDADERSLLVRAGHARGA